MNPVEYIPVVQVEEQGEPDPMPSLNHSAVATNLTYALAPFRKTVDVYHQLNLNLGGWKSVPDLCLYPAGQLPKDWMSDVEEVTEPPAHVIEVLSRNQSLQTLLDKVREYFAHGVGTCWIVIPGGRTIMAFPQTGRSHSQSEGVLREEHLGIEIRVEDVFGDD